MAIWPCPVAIVLAVCVWSGCAAAAEPAARWPLGTDGQDVSGNARHLENHGVAFGAPSPDGTPAARFDGRAAWLGLPESTAPGFGAGEFSLSLWVHTEEVLDDNLGDLVSKYDASSRTGLNLGILTCSGVSNSQPNYRTVHFGIDQGQLDTQWTDCGRPGNAVFIFGMAVHEGDLYAATCEPGAGESGRVYRYAGGSTWLDCGSPDASNAVGALAVYDGRLYAGTSWYDTTGSALDASPNTTPGGKVYRYDGGTQWTYCGTLSNSETGEAGTMGGMGVYRGKLYATTLKREGFGLYRFEGGSEWVYCGNPGRRVLNPSVFNGGLYMVSYDAPGGPFRYDGATWDYTGKTIDPPIHQDYSFTVYGGRLHVSTWPDANVYRLDENGVWTLCGRPGEELETMGMMVYNGALYTGTLPSSKVYRYDGGTRWTPIGQQLDTAEGKYRRAWSMAVYQGKLFCGTLPSGRVFCLEAGRNATCDDALEPGWRHVAAVREAGRLRLYIDGRPVAVSASFDPASYNLANGEPLRLGAGSGDFFNGWMRDVRLYETALPEQDVLELHRAGHGAE